MDVPDWIIDIGKVGAGAVTGVFAGTRRMEERVRKLEAGQQATAARLTTHDEKLETVHELVTKDHDLLTQVAGNVKLILESMQLRSRP